MDIEKAIRILKNSNVMLLKHTEKIKSKSSKGFKLVKRYYDVIKNCEDEYKAVELAVISLEEKAKPNNIEYRGYKFSDLEFLINVYREKGIVINGINDAFLKGYKECEKRYNKILENFGGTQ